MKGFMILPVITCISFFPFLKLSLSSVQIHYFRSKCSSDEGNNYTKNSVYETNLNLALAILSSQAASNRSFFNFTTGTGSNQVYALYLCRGDITHQLCKSCINDATNLLPTQKCPYIKESIIWYNECMLRYSNSNIFSIGVSTNGNWVSWDSDYNVSNPGQLSQVLSDTMNELIKKAVSMETTPAYFQTGEAKLTDFEMVYCLVQCTPDITGFECKRCLLAALAYYPNCCTVGSEWAMMFGESCLMMYDTAPFYNIQPAPPLVPGSTPLEPNSTHDRGHPPLSDRNKNSSGT
ncbi:cysteine-rich repeat secretory protein 38-like [Impatiens glandulifera]|uniref:cysteine-rich repeat secretory protein 38-like n=1 Tax=Impatiens glandulifera TaxID=253017 RepID=UPI001FB0AF35|nr:cysteine-rich repeat secretory protein 38-like [Impatiens glandulifera]